MLVVPANEQGMGSTLTADSPAVAPWTLTPPSHFSASLSGAEIGAERAEN